LVAGDRLLVAGDWCGVRRLAAGGDYGYRGGIFVHQDAEIPDQ